MRETSDGSYYVNQLIDQSDPIGKVKILNANF